MEEKNQPRRPRRSPEEPLQKNESLVYGKNPVTELLKSGSGVDTVLIAEGMAPAVAAYYTALAKEAGATVKRVHPNKLRLMTGTESHQGVAAFASEIEYVTVDDLMAAAKDKGEAPFLVLSDGIEDPHNLGAVMRSALLCGAHGIVIPKRGGASVTPTVIKSSAGAAERLPVARVANIGETIRRLKEQGVFVYCADMDGVSLRRNNLTGPIALVLGSEGSGVSQLVKSCATVWCGWIWQHRAPVWTATTCRWLRVLFCTRSSPSAQHSRHDPAFGPEPQFELQEGQECRKTKIMAGK